MLVSDGVTQAGLGNGLAYGWEIKGVARYITDQIMLHNQDPLLIPETVHDKARQYWGDIKGDDCTVILAQSRKGIILNIMQSAANLSAF